MPQANSDDVTRLSLVIPKDWEKALRETADAAGKSRMAMLRQIVRQSLARRGYGRLSEFDDRRGKYSREERGLLSERTRKQRRRRAKQREYTAKWRRKMERQFKPKPCNLPVFEFATDGYITRPTDECDVEVGHIRSDGTLELQGYTPESAIFAALLREIDKDPTAGRGELVDRFLERCTREYPGVVAAHEQLMKEVDGYH